MVLSELKVNAAAREQRDESTVVKSYAKKLRNSAEEYRELGRPDKAEELDAQREVVREFLPRQLGREEIEALVDDLIAEGDYGPGDLGGVMKAIMSEHGDRVDGSLVQQVARRKLSEPD
jgi:hypothetical protein